MSGPGRRPSWLTAALIGAGSFLAGVLLVAALGGAKGTTSTTTQRVTVTAAATARVPEDGVVRVPDVAEQPLDAARDALEGAGLEVDVRGGGLLGVVDESNWQVVRQSPAEGTEARAGDTVTVDICRRDGC